MRLQYVSGPFKDLSINGQWMLTGDNVWGLGVWIGPQMENDVIFAIAGLRGQFHQALLIGAAAGVPFNDILPSGAQFFRLQGNNNKIFRSICEEFLSVLYSINNNNATFHSTKNQKGISFEVLMMQYENWFPLLEEEEWIDAEAQAQAHLFKLIMFSLRTRISKLSLLGFLADRPRIFHHQTTFHLYKKDFKEKLATEHILYPAKWKVFTFSC